MALHPAATTEPVSEFQLLCDRCKRLVAENKEKEPVFSAYSTAIAKFTEEMDAWNKRSEELERRGEPRSVDEERGEELRCIQQLMRFKEQAKKVEILKIATSHADRELGDFLNPLTYDVFVRLKKIDPEAASKLESACTVAKEIFLEISFQHLRVEGLHTRLSKAIKHITEHPLLCLHQRIDRRGKDGGIIALLPVAIAQKASRLARNLPFWNGWSQLKEPPHASTTTLHLIPLLTSPPELDLLSEQVPKQGEQPGPSTATSDTNGG